MIPWFERIQEEVGPLQFVACDEKADDLVWNLDFRKPTVLLLGNERRGLSAAYRSLANRAVRIPMSGAASSLNVAVAGSIMLYEVVRQRRDEGR